MAKVNEIVRRLLESGSAKTPDPGSCPRWPPDVFAVAATLASLSSCYAWPRYLGGDITARKFDEPYRQRVYAAADTWNSGQVPTRAEELWQTLVRTNLDVCSEGALAEPWWDACLELIAIADEACAGIGFLQESNSGSFAAYFLTHYRNWYEGKVSDLPYLPKSLCVRIDPSEACVLPKTVTPQVGATLRSLTYNLSLVPPRGEATVHWHLGQSYEQADLRSPPPLNLLLVPFPYRIDGNCFHPVQTADGDLDFFTVRQGWAENLSSERLRDFIKELIARARPEVGTVGGVILPECALTLDQAKTLADSLRTENLEFLVAGVSADSGARNGVYSALFYQQQIFRQWEQYKHHRWRLEAGQIKRYHLGHALDPSKIWWEAIRIEKRECYFFPFRGGASMCALVCEDLARIEPVQAALRSVGPNLVITILMDGPQLESRWPARYATVLADDPGSAVLTLTSYGMAQRSFVPGRLSDCPVALWKDPYGNAQTLLLPSGTHAIALSLSHSRENQKTIDGRSDEGATSRLVLTGIRSIAVSDSRAWVDLGIDQRYP